MPRLARQISETGVYHIVFRGVNRQNIFECKDDYLKMLGIWDDLKKEMNFQIYAYCLMGNHVHILLKECSQGDISLIMKRCLSKYARWYNNKYDRSGALIANRYKSQPVEFDEYFLSVVRYIHQNPVKAMLVNDISKYEWSSYNQYSKNEPGIADKGYILSLLSQSEFKEFHQTSEKEVFTVDDRVKPGDEEMRRYIIKSYGVEPKQLTALEKKVRNEVLQKLKKLYSIRQIERITGISRGVIFKS